MFTLFVNRARNLTNYEDPRTHILEEGREVVEHTNNVEGTKKVNHVLVISQAATSGNQSNAAAFIISGTLL